MEKNSGESTSTKGVFSEQTFAQVLEKGEPDYDDYTEIDLECLPELGYMDEEVELEVKKITPVEHAHFGELKRHYELQYRMQGNIKPLREFVQEVLQVDGDFFFTGTSWAWSWHQYFWVDLLL